MKTHKIHPSTGARGAAEPSARRRRRIRTTLLVVLPYSVLAGAQGTPVRFTPLQPELFGTGGALVNALADYDNDGDLDLFVGFNGAPNRLYRNESGTFIDIAPSVGLAESRPTRAAAWGDFDGDGDPDLLVGYVPNLRAASVLRLYRNDGSQFTDVTASVGLTRDSGTVRQPVWVDYDADGDLDLFVAFRDRPNALFRNDNGHFTDVAATVGVADRRRSVGAVWFDYDEDGDLDLYVANMDGDANGLYRNDGGHFVDVAALEGVAWGGRTPGDSANGTVRPCAADVDNDGHLDLFMANYGRNGLFLRREGIRYDDVSSAWGVDADSRYDTCAFADVDNDGRIDLYVNGTVTGGISYPDHLYRNTGRRFVEVTPPNIAGLDADHGVQWADIERDGAMDLLLTGSQPGAMHDVLHNELPDSLAARSLAVRVLDGRGHDTRAGAEVRIFAAGTRRLLGMRLVDSGSGYDAQSEQPVHVGLPSMAPVDVEVEWPAAGRRVVTRVAGVRPADGRGRALEVRVGN